jgi:hypothetical protein
MARGIVSNSDIIDESIEEKSLKLVTLQNRSKFVPVFEFNRANTTFNGKLVSYTVSGTPQDIIFANGYLWVTTNSAGVKKIDPATGSVIATGLSDVTQLKAVVWDGTNIWVASQTTNRIYKINPTDASTVASLIVNGIPYGMCFAPTATNTDLWVCVKDNDALLRIFRTTPSIAQTVNVGDDPFGVCFDGSSLWVTVKADNRVKSVIEASGTVDEDIDQGAGNFPESIIFDGQNIWFTITSGGGDALRKIDLAGNSLGSNPIASFGQLSFNGNYIALTNTTPSTVQIAAIWSNIVQNIYNVDSAPKGITFDGTYFWTAGNNSISRLLV